MKQYLGFSLIEVLVTLLLTTIGILGMVAMQGRSIQYTQDSVQRNAAIMLADELVGIMRANAGELYTKIPPIEPFYSGLKSDSLFYKKAGSAFATAVADCVRSSENIPKTAQEMRDCWVADAIAALPGEANLFNSDSYICRSSLPGECDDKGTMVEIQLAWSVQDNACLDDHDDRELDATTCVYRLRVEL